MLGGQHHLWTPQTCVFKRALNRSFFWKCFYSHSPRWKINQPWTFCYQNSKQSKHEVNSQMRARKVLNLSPFRMSNRFFFVNRNCSNGLKESKQCINHNINLILGMAVWMWLEQEINCILSIYFKKSYKTHEDRRVEMTDLCEIGNEVLM